MLLSVEGGYSGNINKYAYWLRCSFVRAIPARVVRISGFKYNFSPVIVNFEINGLKISTQDHQEIVVTILVWREGRRYKRIVIDRNDDDRCVYAASLIGNNQHYVVFSFQVVLLNRVLNSGGITVSKTPEPAV